jgi:hypothetical protein
LIALLKEVQEGFYVRKIIEKCACTTEELKKYSQDYYQKRLEFAKKKANNEKAGPEVKDAQKKANAYKSRKDRVSLID